MTERKKAHILQQAWAAGVFDAKVSVPRAGYVLKIETVDEPLLRRFHETVGFGQLVERPKKECSRPLWTFQTINMDDSRELILMFSPFLSAMRLKQLSEMLSRIERNPKWRRENPEKASSCVTSNARSAEA